MNEQNLLLFEEEGIDLKKWLLLFYRNWIWFLACMIIALAIAGIVIIKAPIRFELSSKILVNNDNNPLDKSQLFNSAYYNDPYQLENEKGILSSKSITRNALRKLDFEVCYYEQGQFKNRELYNDSPFIINIDTAFLQAIGVLFQVNILSDTLLFIEGRGEEIMMYDYSTHREKGKIPEFYFSDTIKYGELVGNSFCRFTVFPKYQALSRNSSSHNYLFQFISQQQLVKIFRGFKIENDKSSSILKVSTQYQNPAKAADFINELLNEYLLRGVNRDNQIAAATIRFIDAQLIELVDSLQISGKKLQDFRSSKKVIDIGFQVEKVYSKLEKLEADKAKLLVKKRYFVYLIKNLRSKSGVNDLISPASFDINDQVLNNLLVELADLYSERADMRFNSIKDNPYLTSLDQKVNETRRKMLDAISNLLQATEISLEELGSQISNAEQILDRLPRDQQHLKNIERKFKLNDELYTYLLTRRSDMEIFKASNLPVNEVLDIAELEDAKKVSPNIRIIIFIALILGVSLPGLLLYFRETLNNRIRSREDIQGLSKHPLIGQVVGTEHTEAPVVLKEPNSVLTESYRTLRTNMQFVIDESVSNTILVTSAVQGEGKSFTALNLAAVYAFYGKKTVLVDFDLRKSKIQENLKIKSNVGLSNYLSKNCSIDKVITSRDDTNFDLILSGPVPPNPSELVASELTGEFLNTLREKYDIIIIDSPPVGIVSDSLLLYPFVDITLLVVRYNYTTTDMFENLMIDLDARKLEKVNILLNDVAISKSGYGYGYGYVSDKKKSNFWSWRKS